MTSNSGQHSEPTEKAAAPLSVSHTANAAPEPWDLIAAYLEGRTA